MPRQDALVTVIDGHEIGSLDTTEEEGLNHPTAVCTYGMGPDVTITIGDNVSIKMDIAETVNLIDSLRAAVKEFTKRREVFEQYYHKLHK